MTKLSANRAAKEAGIAKKTLLESISSGRLSAVKNDRGHWEIEPVELFRVYPKTGFVESRKLQPTPQENHQKTSETGALEIEVKLLREKIDTMASERDRERSQLVDQIEDLRARLDGAEAERVRLNVLLTDQREKKDAPPKRGFWARLAR